MTTLFPRRVTCPVCGTGFEVLVVGSSNSFGPRTTDLYQFAAGMQPLEYLVHTCPGCGFTADASGLEHAPSPAVRERVRAELAPLAAAAQEDAALRWSFAARIAEWSGAGAFDIGSHELRAAWCAQLAGRPSVANGYRACAADAFEAALAAGEIPAEARLPYSYLIGELRRRTGDLDAARHWLTRAIAMAGDGEEQRWWADLARRQLDDPSDTIEEHRLVS